MGYLGVSSFSSSSLTCSLLLLSLREEISDFFSGGAGGCSALSLLAAAGAEAASLEFSLAGAASSGLLIKASKQENKAGWRKIMVRAFQAT